MAETIIRMAVEAVPERCRFHGEDFGFLGFEYSRPALPRCDSCKEPWLRQEALAELNRRASA